MATASNFLSVEKSPLYEEMLLDPGKLRELVGEGATDVAAKAVTLFNKFESNQNAVKLINQTAAELGIIK